MSRQELLERAERLRSERIPFVLATVVRAIAPTSAKPGDMAVILSDGTMEGFVGGSCAQSAARTESLKLLDSRRSTLLRIAPEGSMSPDAEGIICVSNTCSSGGLIEMFLEPALPQPLLHVAGQGPIAEALRNAAPLLGFALNGPIDTAEVPADAEAIVLATHGIGEDSVLEAALASDIRYIGLVASRRRAASVFDTLELSDAQRLRIHSPAGLDIGAKTPQEVALSILAEIVSERSSSDVPVGNSASSEVRIAVDPICQMEVAALPSSIHTHYQGVEYYFCADGCRAAFLADPERFVVETGA